MDNKYQEILQTEYSIEFDKLRQNRSVTSFYKYGPIAVNYGEKLTDSLGTMELCLNKYKKTGNTEYLVDAANYLMFEFMYPQHKDAHFKPTDSSESAGKVGSCVKEIELL